MCDIFSNRSHHTFDDQADRKGRGFKYFGRNFDVLRLKLPVVTRVTIASNSFEVSIMFCCQITSYVANYSSCRTLIGYFNVFRITWMCLKTLRTTLVHGNQDQSCLPC